MFYANVSVSFLYLIMINIVVGTNREGSLSLVASQEISAIYTDLGIDNQLLLLSDLPNETFSPQAYADKPQCVVDMTNEILKSSGLVVVTPEYNGSMPGALKLFIDLLPFPESFEGRPVSFVGLSAGQFGALRPVEHLQQIFGYRNAYIFPERVFIPRVHESISQADGITDEDLKSRLKKHADGFAGYCRKLGCLD